MLDPRSSNTPPRQSSTAPQSPFPLAHHSSAHSGSKRPRSSSPHVPGSPTGSSPKRAMSEEHFNDRHSPSVGPSGNGSTSGGSASTPASGLANSSTVPPEAELEDQAMGSPSGGVEGSSSMEHMIDPDLQGDPEMGQAAGTMNVAPPVPEVIRLIRESHEAELHPDHPMYIIPSTVLTSLLALPASTLTRSQSTTHPSTFSQPILDLTPLIANDLYDSPEGKFSPTRAAVGSESSRRLKDGLSEIDWTGFGVEGKKGDDEDEDEEAGQRLPSMVYINEDLWMKLVEWYGPAMPKDGIKCSVKTDPQSATFLSIDLSPPTFIIHRAFASPSSIAVQPESEGQLQVLPLRITLPTYSQVSDLHQAAVTALLHDAEQSLPQTEQDYPPSRLWRLELDPSIVGKAQNDEAARARAASVARIDESLDAQEATTTTGLGGGLGLPAPNMMDSMMSTLSTTKPPSTLLIPSHLLPACGAKLVFEMPRKPNTPDVDIGDAFLNHGDVFAVEFGQVQENGEVEWIVGVNEQDMAVELGAEPPAVDEDTHMQSPAPEAVAEAPKPLFTSLAFSGTHKEPAAASTSTAVAATAATAKETPSGMVTRSKNGEKHEGKTAVRGLKGLSNLGNTCFMNSALQCLSNTSELTKYIMSGVYKDEINRENPLGMHGRIADAFGHLIEELWDPSASKSSSSYFGYGNSIAPREVKGTIGRFAPQFQGYGQQDTQELLAFLLDGLHEDLNRIEKKPYVEKPDWKDGGGDEELALMGKDCWEGYKKRNDSVIVDLFQGQLKSTLICPVCHKESITLDPFMYLTVPLPVKTVKEREVFVVPADPSAQRFKITVQYTPSTSFSALKKKLGGILGIQGDHLLATDEWSHKIYEYWFDDTAVSDAKNNDVIVFHELPRAVKQSFKGNTFADESKDNKEQTSVTVPVYSQDSDRRLFARPFFITLNANELKSVSAIKKAVAKGYSSIVDHDKEDDLMTVMAAASSPTTADGPGEVAQNVTDLHIDDDKVASGSGSGAHQDHKPNHNINRISSKSSIASTVHAPGETQARNDLYNVTFAAGKEGFLSSQTKGFYKSDPPHQTYSPADWKAKKKPLLDKFVGGFRGKKGSEDESEPSEAQLLSHGDLIVCEWKHAAVMTYFGHDKEGRYRSKEDYVAHEDPAVQAERKKAEKAQNKGITLDDCLDEFSKEETLGENDLWYCPHCKEHRAATKRMEIYQLPDILVICLKRFGSRGSFGKINATVDFPVTNLDLEDRTQSRQIGKALQAKGKNPEDFGIPPMDEPLIYDLYAVDNHYGGLGGGHYTAHAINQDNNKWYYFDDSSVRESSESDLSGSSAYLLFYHRRSKRPRGAATAAKVAEAESAASSMILDPALAPHKLAGPSTLRSTETETSSPESSEAFSPASMDTARSSPGSPSGPTSPFNYTDRTDTDEGLPAYHQIEEPIVTVQESESQDDDFVSIDNEAGDGSGSTDEGVVVERADAESQ